MMIDPYRFKPATGGDPYFANVVLLLHCDGTNGSTTFTDNSSSGKTVTANNDAQVSTSSPKFGTGAAAFDGTGDYLSLADSNDWDFGSGDFTIEYWINSANASAGVYSIINQRSSSAVNCPIVIYREANAIKVLLSFDNGSWVAVPTISGTIPVSAATWYHVALTRSGSSFKLWLNGVQNGSTLTSSGTFTNKADLLTIGGAGTDQSWNGSIDDIRITKGVARDVTTVPTAAFPDS